MEINSNSLQELINKRAEAKAKKEIITLRDALRTSGILNIGGFFVKEGGISRALNYALDDTSLSDENNIITQLYNEKVAKYIISETKDFVSKVESLVEQTDNLLNIAENY